MAGLRNRIVTHHDAGIDLKLARHNSPPPREQRIPKLAASDRRAEIANIDEFTNPSIHLCFVIPNIRISLFPSIRVIRG